MGKLRILFRMTLLASFFGCVAGAGTVGTEKTVPDPGEVPVETGDPSSQFQGDRGQVLSLLASSAERILARQTPVFLHDDHGENITLVTDEDAAVSAQQAFKPYGVERGPPTRSTRYGFSGQEVDQSTGFIHYRYREFDPLRANWVSVDPVFSISTPKKLASHLDESTHGYTFIGNHPINGIDPYGLSKAGQALSTYTAKLKAGLGLSKYRNVRGMTSDYRGESSEAGTTNHGRTYRTRYLNKKERQLHKVLFFKGHMYVPSEDGIHRPLDTTITPQGGGGPFFGKTPSSAHSGAGYAIFVQDPEGQIYVGRHDIYDSAGGKKGFHHSSFLAGAPVSAAGEMVVRNGVLQVVTSKSGHYQPTDKHMMNLGKQLTEQGIDPSRVQFASGGYAMGTLARPWSNDTITQ